PSSTRSCRPATSRRAPGRPISCWRPCAKRGSKNQKPDAMIASGFRTFPELRPLLPLVHRDIVAAGDACVELARAADLLLRILDHLAPLADPADRARDREQ